MDKDIIQIVLMVLTGAITGSLAARLIKGTNFGFIINALLGIAGVVVGSYLFDFLNMTPGSGIVKIIRETFDVSLPLNFVGLLVAGTVGASAILLASKVLGFGKR